MTDLAVRAANLGKRYQMGELQPYGALRDSIGNAARSSLRRVASLGRGRDSAGPVATPQPEHIWALRHVSFEVRTGEVVGIIGRNGAGKSTLLKILSRITEPTEGEAALWGRVGSLLEVGTGFHAELTGRENIFLNGAILGMGRAEMRRKFDDIVEFAEVGRFIDTPVKRYSSGMHMRLAFAVAAHLEPEILIVDEVLAVGDAAFQRKCLGKIGAVAGEGRTVLFVSHNMAAVEGLCTRAMWIDRGGVLADGPAAGVVSRYLQSTFTSRTEREWTDPAGAPGNDRVRVRRACIRAEDPANEEITVRTPLAIEFEYWNLRPGARLNLSLHLYDETGMMVFNALPMNEVVWQGRPFPRGLFRDVCHIPGDLLNNGAHSIELLVIENDTTPVFRMDEALVFEVADDYEGRGGWHGQWPGAVRPSLRWETELLGEGPPVADAPVPSSAAPEA